MICETVSSTILLTYTSATLGFIGMLANTIQVVLICRDSKQRKTVFGLAVLSLSAADLLSSVIHVWAGVCYFLKISTIADLSLTGERPILAIFAFSLTSSFTHVIYISIQRVIAVAFPFRVNQILTKSRGVIVTAILWLTSIALALVLFFKIEAIAVLSYLAMITGVTMIIMYSVICYKTMRRSIDSCSISEEMQRSRQKTEREVLFYSVVVTAIFVICNFPISIGVLVTYPAIFLSVSDVLFSSNPFLDTLLYFAWSYFNRRKNAAAKHAPVALQLQARIDETDANCTTDL